MLPSELSLGPFKIDDKGLLSPATPESFPRFAVRWRGRVLHISMRQCSAEDSAHGVLELSVRIGRVPSSVGISAPRRQSALAMAHLLPRLMPAQWQGRLMPDHTILLETALAIALPVSATDLVGDLATFLLQLDPYLAELDAEGLAHSHPVPHSVPHPVH